METTSELISAAERYCASRGISLSRLGGLAVNDGKFFRRLQAGGSCTIDTLNKVRRYMADNPVVSDERAA